MREKYDNMISNSACKITVLMQDINADPQGTNPFWKSNFNINE